MKPKNTSPESYPRRILVAVTGLSPQIVTETLYALAFARTPRFIPTEVRLITTEEGAQRAQLSLLHEQTGWFHRLCKDYQLPPIAFRPEQIHVLRNARGNPLGDIRSVADNTVAADAITELMRELTGDGDSALHVSIAGGRKTMGFYLGYALSLYGRIQDRLSHVLVNAPYESHPDFFYPTPKSELIHTPGPSGRPYDARDADVTLAEIPFVRMREGLDPKLMEGNANFSGAVADAQRSLPPLALKLEPASESVTIAGETFRLLPNLFALYWMLAERLLDGRGGTHWSEDRYVQEFLSYYGRLVRTMSAEYERAEQAAKHGLTGENVDPIKSHIKRSFESHVGRRRAAPYLIKKQDHIPGTRYRRFGLDLPREVVHIAGRNLADSSSEQER